MTPQLLRHEHLNAAARLLERVNLAGGVANIGRYLRWQPDGVWGLLDGDALIGMVSLLRFGPVGFVGCMAVEPALQGQGLGRLLLEHAHAAGRRHGIATFLLEATAAGEPMYRRLGYVAEYQSAIVGRDGIRLVDAVSLRAERDAIRALDRVTTGSPRDVMIDGLVDAYAGATAQIGGELAGFGLVVGERLGPVIARDPGAGRAIVDRLAGACTIAAAPLANAPALAALAANGFAELRTITRMRLGPEVPIRVPWVWALASPGAG
jgi:GNAT superfamily N-acetyltransferase